MFEAVLEMGGLFFTKVEDVLGGIKVADCYGEFGDKIVTPKDVARAVEAVLRGNEWEKTRTRKYVTLAVTNNDLGHIDGEAGDVLMQIAALGKYTYA